jgi:hypothetical protein
MDYTGVIEALDAYHRAASTQLDVFVEIDAPNNPGKAGSKLYRGALQLFNRGVRKALGSSLNLVTSRTDFAKKLYFHGTETGASQRYHYIDFRATQLFVDYGFDINHMILGGILVERGDMEILNTYLNEFHSTIHARYPTQKDLIDTLKDFLFGKPFDPAYRHRDRLSHGMTRIAKQFYKLESRADQTLVRSFALGRLRAIFKENPYRLPGHSWTAVFNSLILLVDIYAICRFLRFFGRQGAGSTSVFLAGVFHVENYRAFLAAWGANETFLSDREWTKGMAYAKKCAKVDLEP